MAWGDFSLKHKRFVDFRIRRAKNFKRLREDRGLSQEMVSLRMGKPKLWAHRIESGYGLIRPADIVSLCDIFNVKAMEFERPLPEDCKESNAWTKPKELKPK